MRALAACGIALLLCASAYAGDDATSWTFEVLEVTESNPPGHIIRLRPSPPGRSFPRSCPVFVIYSIFDIDDWSESARREISRAQHDRAVLALVQAQASNRLIRIGTLGPGFAAMQEKSRCEVASRALQHTVYRGTPAILSFYDEP
jgi:hypothetical protein